MYYLVGAPIYFVFGDFYGASIFSGALFMYVVYDMIHYWVHHLNPADGTYFKNMKVYHM